MKRRVLDGGVGCTSGGRFERSSVSDFLEATEEARDDRDGGDGLVSCAIVRESNELFLLEEEWSNVGNPEGS